ncbi:MAG: acyltransferase, partial [Clostridia bacterium]|nr:acyltransferase [Clostridia bacterium]
MEDLKNMQFSDEEYAAYVRLTSMSDNGPDDIRRAEMLGLGGKDILVAPGAIIRVPDMREKFGRDIFVGLYVYINGDVTVEDHVLIGPHCSIAAGNHKFDPQTGYF